MPCCDRTIRVQRTQIIPHAIRGDVVLRTPETIGGHLRRRRAQRRLHQRQTAPLLGISTVTLSRWELDKVYPTRPYHPRIVAFLGYDPFQTEAKS